MTGSVGRRPGDADDLGALSLALLLVTLCAMALGLLIASMSVSTLTLSETRAETVRSTYRLESVAQSLVARLDGACSRGMSPGEALGVALAEPRDDEGDPAGRVDVSGAYEDGLVRLRLERGRRTLAVALEPTPEGMEVREWAMGAMPNEEPSLGSLL